MQYDNKAHYASILLVLLSSLCYAILNCVFKSLSHNMPPMVMIFYRNFFTVIVILPILLKYQLNFRSLVNKRILMMNIARGCVGFIGMCFWILAIAKMPITECIAISFTTPIFITLMAIPIFKEKVVKTKWLAIFCAFFGALMIVTPDFANLNFYGLLVVLTSLLWALGAIIVKLFVKDNHPIPVILFMAVLSMALSSPAVIENVYVPSSKELFLIFISAILSSIAQLSMGFAYKKAPITFIIPFDFTRLVFGAIIAYLFFNELIRITTLIGSIIIVLSALIIGLIDKNTKHR